MKNRIYFFVLFLFMNVLNSCTPDDSVEIGIQSELEENIAIGEEETPREKDKSGE